MDRIALPVSPLTVEAFAPYGRVLSPSGARDTGREGYDIWIQPFAAESRPRLQIVRYHARPFVVALIERHLHVPEARQPLSGSPAIIVVANRAATTGRCLMLLFIAVTRSTSNAKKCFRRNRRRQAALPCPKRVSRSSRTGFAKARKTTNR